jgi:transposase-like protein
MVRTRRLFTKEFKLSVIGELDAGASLGEAARRHNLHPDLLLCPVFLPGPSADLANH